VGGTVLVGGSEVALGAAVGAGVGGGGWVSDGTTVDVAARVGTAVGGAMLGVTVVQAVKKRLTTETQRNKPGFSKKPGLFLCAFDTGKGEAFGSCFILYQNALAECFAPTNARKGRKKNETTEAQLQRSAARRTLKNHEEMRCLGLDKGEAFGSRFVLHQNTLAECFAPTIPRIELTSFLGGTWFVILVFSLCSLCLSGEIPITVPPSILRPAPPTR
jgi:hypothetical protein